MNERIKELMEQCYETGPIGRDGWPEYSKLNEGKFAELIVRECANLFEIEYGTSEVSGNEVAKVLKKHFGVEE